MKNLLGPFAVAMACAALLSCNGCAGFLNPGAESFVSVQGRVSNVEPRAACDLKLFSEGGEARQTLPVRGEFKTSLVTAPGAHKYYVEVSCPGHAGIFRSAVYELGGGTRTLDLGVVALQ